MMVKGDFLIGVLFADHDSRWRRLFFERTVVVAPLCAVGGQG